ncbi:putative haloalkanoic acid dehalogenase [Aspergillus saccharolyticus JOP 1030-1]|uniref:Metallo-dependent hydrolase n=1 Tax=Aspergillus saccharolyticus JOP 1030-1 TaxID=1450539 RepID=A0A319ANM4_9EURO|nr:hypothetical protein BP01DRAFT_413847 [Aspergillus saccharolyticus JOP 1030-1]PYH48092.1 hypothetical protein BP01DRAFT_413847 [Aspergillus saccharolyticus JOP 1030-1]
MTQLSDYRLLTFDVYGTLVDWETGILTAFQPTLDETNAQFSRHHLLTLYHELERAQQEQTPEMPYSELLTTIHPTWARRLNLPVPSHDESIRFGESVGKWPAFPDTVDALRRLSKHYKLVVLSNVDRASFAKTNAGSLEGFQFDLIITAQDVGGYKPDLKNFEYMLRAVKEGFGVEKEQVLQTAQSQFHDHHPARKMGIRSVAVTYTADQFHGIYRGGKQHHAPDWPHVVERALAHNCEKMLLTTMTLAGAHQNLAITQEYPTICSMTLGVHPYHVSEIYTSEAETQPEAEPGTDYLMRLRDLGHSLLTLQPTPLVAFGEIGLDYVYLDRANKATQQRAFRAQLDIAVDLQLPLFLHVRGEGACADVVDILRPYLGRLPQTRKGLVHSFAGSAAEMRLLVGLGFGVSVNGVSFRTEEGREMVREVPLEVLQLETDAPWCEVVEDEHTRQFLEGAKPLPAARKSNRFVEGLMVKGRNESCAMERVARVVAGLKGVEVEVVAEAAWRNSVAMFGLGVGMEEVNGEVKG